MCCDESDRNGLKITIDLKRGTNVELLMHKLFAMTPLSDSFSCNFNVLIHGKPMTLGVGEILKHWTDFRMVPSADSLHLIFRGNPKNITCSKGFPKS